MINENKRIKMEIEKMGQKILSFKNKIDIIINISNNYPIFYFIY